LNNKDVLPGLLVFANLVAGGKYTKTVFEALIWSYSQVGKKIWMPVARYWMLVSGYWIMDTR
jgi:hypothetical protein